MSKEIKKAVNGCNGSGLQVFEGLQTESLEEYLKRCEKERKNMGKVEK